LSHKIRKLYKKYGKAREAEGTVDDRNTIWRDINAICFWMIEDK
jgi:hypothetical protein